MMDIFPSLKDIYNNKISNNKDKKIITAPYFYEESGTMQEKLNIDEEAPPPEIILIDYNKENFQKNKLNSPEECIPYLDNSSISWIDIQGLGSEDILKRVGKVFNLHPLVLEDIVNVPQRPKVEEYDNYILLILQTANIQRKELLFKKEQISFIIGKNYLLTVQEEPKFDPFQGVRDKISSDKGVIRKRDVDYLVYSLIDAIVDEFFPILEEYGEAIERLEQEIVTKPTKLSLENIHRTRRELLELRRMIWPLREIINILIRDENDLIGKDVRIYLRDCYDHVIQTLDMVETYREVAYSLMDVYMSSVANKMNDIMKLLTVISTIFIPLTFLAGVYGMNFKTDVSPFNMPELSWYWGYPAFWAVIIIVASSLIGFFWKRGWFEKFSTVEDENK